MNNAVGSFMEDESSPRAWLLGDLVQIIPGYTDRVKSAADPRLPRIVNARDITEGDVAWDQLGHCERKPAAERAFLHDGDLLVTVRGAEPRAIRIHRPPADVVAGAPFAILRAGAGVVDLDYLHWFLNAPGPRERLRAQFRGSSITFLSLADLAAFPVTVPTRTRQLAIVRVHALRTRLTSLTNRLDQSLGLLLEQAATTSSHV